MILTKKDIADNLLNYLQYKTSLNELVSWAELMVMDAEIKEEQFEIEHNINPFKPTSNEEKA